MVLTGYGLFGARRFTGDRKAAHRAGDRSRPFQGAEVNPFMATRPARPGGAMPRRSGPRSAAAPGLLTATARAVCAPAAGRSRRGPGGMHQWPVAVSKVTSPGTAGGVCGGVGGGHGRETSSPGASVPAPRHRPAGRPAGQSERHSGPDLRSTAPCIAK
jgi:hypothetical protein